MALSSSQTQSTKWLSNAVASSLAIRWDSRRFEAHCVSLLRANGPIRCGINVNAAIASLNCLQICVYDHDSAIRAWHNFSNFMRDELPVLEHLTRQAFAFILEQEANRPAR